MRWYHQLSLFLAHFGCVVVRVLQVVFPLYDPATTITIGVYSTSSKGVRATLQHIPSAWCNAHVHAPAVPFRCRHTHVHCTACHAHRAADLDFKEGRLLSGVKYSLGAIAAVLVVHATAFACISPFPKATPTCLVLGIGAW